MRERESFGDLLKLIIGTFKEYVERSLFHMIDIMQLLEPPFQQANKETNEVGTSKANEELNPLGISSGLTQ